MGRWSRAKWIVLWPIAKAVEGLWQDWNVQQSWWKGVLALGGNLSLPTIGGVVMWTFIRDHWAHALAGGVGTFVVLAYVSAIIRVWCMGRRGNGLESSPTVAAKPETGLEIKRPSEQAVNIVTTEDALRIALPNVVAPDPLASLDSAIPVRVILASSLPAMKSSTGSHAQVDTLGSIRQVFIEYLEHPTRRWECTCAVDFHEIGKSIVVVFNGKRQVPK